MTEWSRLGSRQIGQTGLLGEVAALTAEADPLLGLPDRLREGDRLLLRRAQEMEREPLRGARADARQAGQLGDQVVDDGTLHPLNRTERTGASGR